MITYLTGDATRPPAEGAKIIAHICNDVGGWGAGFVVAISRRWREPEAAYRDWARSGEHPDVYGKSKTFTLGNVQLVKVGAPSDIWVANMVAQKGYGARGTAPHQTEDEDDGKPPIRYDELGICLLRLNGIAERLEASVHMPRIGCGLAGGKWDKVEPLIKQMLDGRQVYVYDL